MEKKATTLIELVIALAIAAGIGAVTLVAFSLLDRRSLESSVRSLYVDLSWAKTQALVHQHNYLFVIDTANKSYKTGEDKDDNDTLSAAEEEKYKKLSCSIAVTPEATIRLRKLFGTSIDASGDPVDPPVQITLTRAGRSKQVNVISGTGFLEIQ